MRPFRWIVIVFLFCLLTASRIDCGTPNAPLHSDQPVAITHVSVIPMDHERVLENQTVLIAEGRIIAIAPADSIEVPADALQIDGSGRYVLPSFADMHAHTSRREGHRLEDYLRQGVTIVRNMQGVPSHLAFRAQVQDGGPIFVTAGQALAGYRISDDHRIVTDTASARAVVREQAEAGYDYIKVYSFLSREVYDAIMDEAEALGIPVVGHVSDHVRASHAIASGLSSIEHFYGYFWELEAETSGLNGEWAPRRLFHAVEIDEAKLVPLAEMTAAAGVWNCPTLWRKDHHLTSSLAEDAWNTPALRTLGHANRMKLVKALHDAGAGLLAGTDDRAEIIHEELTLFVEAGLTPFEALQTTTVNAAAYLGLSEEVGTVAVGKRAHLVLLNANPLTHIRHTRNLVGVVVDGAWMPSE